jgi:hypothetical protein
MVLHDDDEDVSDLASVRTQYVLAVDPGERAAQERARHGGAQQNGFGCPCRPIDTISGFHTLLLVIVLLNVVSHRFPGPSFFIVVLNHRGKAKLHVTIVISRLLKWRAGNETVTCPISEYQWKHFGEFHRSVGIFLFVGTLERCCAGCPTASNYAGIFVTISGILGVIAGIGAGVGAIAGITLGIGAGIGGRSGPGNFSMPP